MPDRQVAGQECLDWRSTHGRIGQNSRIAGERFGCHDRLSCREWETGLRGEAAQQEADFVKGLAQKIAIPCICELQDVRAEKEASGACLQEAARNARYRFLNNVFKRCQAQKLALGHTMDDQAETVLIRLLRGASTRGLAGIPPVNC